MFIAAKRKHLNECRFVEGNLKRGETFSVDSGLGGSHTVAYVGHCAGRLLFEREHTDDWPAARYWFADEQDAARRLFILVPEGGPS